VKSPLNESLAAGLLMLTDWDRQSPMVDPMCGSGTFLIEAAHLALDHAPGLNRSFPFTRWPDFSRDRWEGIRAEARDRRKRSLDFQLLGSDRHGGAIGIAESSARNAGVLPHVNLQHCDARSYAPPGDPQLAVVNPPYGERLGAGDDLIETWHTLGQFFRRELAGRRVFVLSGNQELTRHLRLRANRRHPVRNGPIDCRWLEYELLAARPSPSE